MTERHPPADLDAPGPDPELLVAGLVHELRQPLMGVDAGLKLAARALGASARELEGWELATGQLVRLQETLDTYRQLVSGDADLDEFVVAPVVRRVSAALHHRLEALGDHFGVTVEPDVPRAYGSPRALEHAIQNLLGNALDAVKGVEGGARVEVRVLRASGAEPRPQVRVSDAGVGISAASRRRLFRARFTTKPRGEGSGLGLAIARTMVRGAGGEVRLARDDDPQRRPWARTEFVVDLAASATAPAPREAKPPREPRIARAVWAFATTFIFIGVLAVGWTAFDRWVRASDSPPGATLTAPVDRIEVVAVSGSLDRLRSGEWKRVSPRDVLQQEDTIRTAAGSGATIAIGDRARLTVSDATQLTVRELTAAAQRLRLSQGRISVDTQSDGSRVLVIESERGDSVADASAARFSVLANGAALAVATETGVVRLRASGHAVSIGAGEQSVSFRGQSPTAPSAVPLAMILQISRAEQARRGTCEIAGTAPPGAEVRVEGVLTEVGADGRFAARVPLRTAGRGARVTTRDAAGRATERRVACATKPVEHDLSEFSVRWGTNERAADRAR